MSLSWVVGVWACIMGVLPASLKSTDMAFRAFGLSNAILFSIVMVVIVRYHNPKK